MLGPMTNLALAVRLDPSIATKVQKIVFMGGTSAGKGNSSPTGEFNVLADPEAAQIVLDSFRVRLHLVIWWCYCVCCLIYYLYFICFSMLSFWRCMCGLNFVFHLYKKYNSSFYRWTMKTI